MNNFMDSSDDSIASYKSNSSSSIDYHSSLSISFDDNVPDYEQMHEVLEIAGMHTNNGKTEYLVRWKDGSEAEWVDSTNCNCPALIFDFQKKKGYWDSEYEIESVIDSFKFMGRMEYLVKWKDRLEGTEENPITWSNEYSWVKEADMQTAKEAIREFEVSGGLNQSEKQTVERIVGVNRDYPIDYYEIKFTNANESESRYYSVDEIYLMPNGRQALHTFKSSFEFDPPRKSALSIKVK